MLPTALRSSAACTRALGASSSRRCLHVRDFDPPANGALNIESTAGAFFTTYEGAKSFLESYPLPTPLVHALASGLGESVSCAILTPAEVIKQNAQMVSVSSSSTSSSATAQTLARFRQNPRALFSGYGALLGRNLPFTALQFPLYEHLRASFARRRGAAHGQGRDVVGRALDTAAAGAIAGGAAALVTTPVDVIKTRVMLAAALSSGASAQEAVKAGKVVDALGGVSSSSGAKSHRTSHATRGMLAVARDVLRQDGWRGLWRGGALRTSFAALGSGLYLATYESARVWLLRRDGEES
jgi:solute carrier family 25 S-adenosylmethionine transporter 26